MFSLKKRAFYGKVGVKRERASQVAIGGLNLDQQFTQGVEESKTGEQFHQEDLRRLEEFRMIDDTFARVRFKDNPQLAEFGS